MRTGLLFLLIGISIYAPAQQNATEKNFIVAKPKPTIARYFVLVIDGKWYNNGDTLSRDELKAISGRIAREVMDTSTNRTYKILNSHVFISDPYIKTIVREASGPKATFNDVINLATSGDTFWVDELRYSINSPLLPKQFTFTVR